MYKMRIAVLMGGKSSEYDVSIASGENIVKNLDKEKYDIREVRIDKSNNWTVDGKILSPDKALKDIHVAFNAMHGQYGEDGSIQGILEFLGVAYTGSGVLASALSMNKSLARSLFKLNGLLTPSNTIIYKNTWYEHPDIITEIANDFILPCVIKPNSVGSSVGISMVKEIREFEPALENAFQFSREILIEQFLDGDEYTCGVMEIYKAKDIAALPVTKIIPPKGHFFDHAVKYDGTTQEITPAPIDEKLTKYIQRAAINAHKIMQCRGYSRTDVIVKGDDIYVLELNTLPGFTDESLFPKAAKADGIEFSPLLDHLINIATLDHRPSVL